MTMMPHSKKTRSHQYNIAAAKAKLPSLVREALAGDEVVIAKDNRPLVRLVPIAGGPWAPGSAKGQISISADFDEPLPDFDDYT
jgi:prevent-host-death family protein